MAELFVNPLPASLSLMHAPATVCAAAAAQDAEGSVHQGEGKEDMGGGRCGSRRHFLQELARMKKKQHGGRYHGARCSRACECNARAKRAFSAMLVKALEPQQKAS